jgi:hypothetical protein
LSELRGIADSRVAWAERFRRHGQEYNPNPRNIKAAIGG